MTEPEEDEPLYEVVGIILQGKQCNTEDELCKLNEVSVHRIN